MHDICNEDGEQTTLEFLQLVRKTLKPGSILAVGDHIGVTGNDNANLHRIEPKIMLNLIEKVRLSVEATSQLLGNPNDDHTRSVYADGLHYNTERILVRARKPKLKKLHLNHALR